MSYGWSPEADALAETVMARYPQKRSATMHLLYIAMREDGYLTNDGMRRVAGLVDLSPAQVLSVASFYTMYKRRPVGKYLVSVCTSISCWLLGGDDVLHAVEDESGVADGQTDDEGLISPEHVECIGACGGAPALQVNYEFVEGLTPHKARELVRWLKSARPEAAFGDEMQELFGGDTSFDWAIPDHDGAPNPIPAFQALGTINTRDTGTA